MILRSMVPDSLCLFGVFYIYTYVYGKMMGIVL